MKGFNIGHPNITRPYRATIRYVYLGRNFLISVTGMDEEETPAGVT